MISKYHVRWIRCLIALGLSNAIVGALLGALYAWYSYGYDASSVSSAENQGVVWRATIVSGCFGLVVPTLISILSLVLGAKVLRYWPALVCVGPILSSLLSFLFVWNTPDAYIFMAIAAIGGGLLSICSMMLFGGVATVHPVVEVSKTVHK